MNKFMKENNGIKSITVKFNLMDFTKENLKKCLPTIRMKYT